MPHIILEYTDNLSAHTDIKKLLEKINEAVIAQKGVFPIGGIRSRAYEVKDYYVADGKENDAFVHTRIKIGKGRSDNEKSDVCDAIFQVMKTHFNDYMNEHYLALSLELAEFQHATYKSNNIHQRFS
ncbi:5-carboxymethyl-2-hydroxymuconate isomerase [Halobacillus andaensis]|uniref:5-carboxymethyl-2-hydroxymuconate isomerase n=1 Tax=Halobacillus andaensis TaxID=1176239 RepID=A0A917B0J7_HALAA|nr:5-carboxymethyl-2-hydroxymuconate Delta-isomerase [Halobacillus andaensis]MBP2003900.1 5-carboxymethyl-2-hydroxymuconate isomerase [Halobacillus andaensis]GGF14139.1 5-carboxymethyl-2-hydroxymuconate isomerase [Halobacillus andaensis]